jgi:hypothetical protein
MPRHKPPHCQVSFHFYSLRSHAKRIEPAPACASSRNMLRTRPEWRGRNHRKNTKTVERPRARRWYPRSSVVQCRACQMERDSGGAAGRTAKRCCRQWALPDTQGKSLATGLGSVRPPAECVPARAAGSASPHSAALPCAAAIAPPGRRRLEQPHDRGGYRARSRGPPPRPSQLHAPAHECMLAPKQVQADGRATAARRRPTGVSRCWPADEVAGPWWLCRAPVADAWQACLPSGRTQP